MNAVTTCTSTTQRFKVTTKGGNIAPIGVGTEYSCEWGRDEGGNITISIVLAPNTDIATCLRELADSSKSPVVRQALDT